ncbi:MAG: Bax protein [Psychromonas sp.]|jgi:Bax protein
MRQTLFNKVDILPPSLALAQAAEESGWGTSRFAKEGNSFLVNGILVVTA